jgi:K+-transporting ATPase KdpF subunit
MSWVYWLSGAIALGLFVYLVIAMLKPEWFE